MAPDVVAHPQRTSPVVRCTAPRRLPFVPGYRNLWLPAVDDVAARVNGADVPRDRQRVVLPGRSYRTDELSE